MRAIGYYRVKDSGSSPEQLGEHMGEQFADYCKRYLHQPMTTFGDDISGDESSTGTSALPGYRQLLDYLKESQSSFLIVVPDATHLGDDLEAVARTMVRLESDGSKVTCNDDDMPDPLQNALATMGVKGVSRTRSERIKESMRERALMGKGLGKPPFGYRNGQDGTVEVVPEERPVVELIYRLYTKDGIGLRLIAQHLNEREIKTRRGGNWNMVTIRDILKNSTYMGTYTRFGLRLPKSHEAIISPQMFRTAQDETRARKPVGRVVNSQPFLLSGMLFCGYCNNKMMGVTRRQSWKRKDGRRSSGVYRYYQCQSRNNMSLCQYHTWRAPLLESTVMSQLKYALKVGAANGNEAGTDRADEIKAVWDSRMKNADRRFLQAMKRAAKGEMELGVLGEYLKELDKVRRGAENARRPKDVEASLSEWDSMDFGDQQGFLLEHLAKVIVQDDSVDVLV
ncbi:MAG: recombinase family protein [Chloroflexi bacterium]|nr:recombinase family protein [Chloroflexota bacterium]